jgi:ankyrin repeat protein
MTRLLVQAGGDVKFRQRDGHQALHRAVMRRQPAIVAVLAEVGADLDAKGKRGNRPLHVAIKSGGSTSAELVEQLLMLGADPNAADGDGDSPLHVALEEANIDVAELLLLHGADPLVRNKKGLDVVQSVLAKRDFIEAVSTPTHEAAASGDLGRLRVLLEKAGNANIVGPKGKAPLHFAAKAGRLEAAALLLAAGANPNTEAEAGPPLAYAARAKNLAMAELLVKNGADPDAVLSHGRGSRPLLHQAFSEGVDCVDVLLKVGASMESVNSKGETALARALRKRNAAVALRLLAAGADPRLCRVECVYANGHSKVIVTGLVRVARSDEAETAEVIKALLAADCDVDERDGGSVTALLEAVREDPERVEVLIKAGANANARDKKRRSPLYVAARHGRGAAMKVLLGRVLRST